ncbi:galectin-1-like [Macrotis lagotis]|uniref:galectin-1-like n=1 Tax=Macrotis lagotis TaxID=92651 RepID=UPI003D68A7DB
MESLYGGSRITSTDLKLQPGVCIKIEGDIPVDAKRFAIELGKDSGNIGLHISPQFNFRNEEKIIVCNSRNDYYWDQAEKQHYFVFEQGTRTEISVIFEVKEFKIKLPRGCEFTFPNRLNLEEINFLEIRQDFTLRSLTIE